MPSTTIRRFAGKALGLDEGSGGLRYATDALDVDLSHGTLRPMRQDRDVGQLPEGPVTSFMVEDCCAAIGEQCSSFLRLTLPCERYFRVTDGRLQHARSLCGPWSYTGHPCIDTPPTLLTSIKMTEGKVIHRQYVYAVVNEFGEIEAISPPSNFEISDWDREALVHGIVSPLSDDPLGSGTRKIQLYSTAPDLSMGPEAAPTDLNFFLAAEVDYGSSAALHDPRVRMYGDALIPEDYSAPPPNLHSLAGWGSRQIAGIADGELWFSLRGNFAAWPNDARMRFDDAALAFAANGQIGYVLTCGRPVVVNLESDCKDGRCHGASPITEALPLLAPRSVASHGDGVIYASTLGLVYLQGTRWTLLTAGLTREEWFALNPYRMRGVSHRGNYYLSTDAGTWKVMLPGNPFDPGTGRTTISRLSAGAEAWYRTDHGRLLYTPGNRLIRELAEAANFKTMVWDSEPFAPQSGFRHVYVNGSHDVRYSVTAVPYRKGMRPMATTINPESFQTGPGWVRIPAWIDRDWWTIRVVVGWGEVTTVTLSTNRTMKGI